MLQTLFSHGVATVSTCACSRCGKPLPATDINVTADTALCRQCGTTFRFSELIDSGGYLTFDPANSPHGVSYQEFPGGFEARATTRSAEALFLIPFMCIWSGFSLFGIYGSQWQKGHFDLFQFLFGIPFVMGSIFLGSRAIMAAGGRVIVRRSGDEGTILQGIGPFVRSRRFRWSDVESIAEDDASHGPYRGRTYRLISLALRSDPRLTLKFGTLLSDERRWFLISVLRSQIVLWNLPSAGGERS